MEKQPVQHKPKAVVAAQAIFLLNVVLLTLFWMQELARANQLLLAFLAFAFVCCVASAFASKAAGQNYADNWRRGAFGAISLLLLALTILVAMQPHISMLPSLDPWIELLTDFGIHSLYWAAFDILPMAQIVTSVLGVCIICMMTRMNRPT